MPLLPLLSFPYIPFLTLPSFVYSSPFVATIFPVLVGGLIGANTPNPSYTSAHDPPLRPPDITFPLVWTLLYALMGYSSHLAYKSSAASGTFTLYTLQLAANFTFLPLYSAMGERLLGLIDILVLDGFVVTLICAWGGGPGGEKGLKKEAWGLLPYAAWLVFATYLAVAYGVLNGWRGGGRWKVKDGKKEKVA